MKPSHEYTITVTIPCTGDAEHQAQIFSKIREHYVALKTTAAEFGGAGTVAVVRKVTRTAKVNAAPVPDLSTDPSAAVPAHGERAF